MQQLESEMAVSDFYADESAAKQTIARHEALMWEVGDLMNQWEALGNEASAMTSVVETSGRQHQKGEVE